jgi:hypothetical protein
MSLNSSFSPRRSSTKRRHPEQDMTIWGAWSAERPHLMPVGQPFDGFVEHTKRVSSTCLVTT